MLSREAAEPLVHAFVFSRLDNGNALLAGIPNDLLTRLQRVQNAAARCILGLKKRDRITEALRSLHWLPMRARIDFKILLLTWKALNGQAPGYLASLLTPKHHARELRSSSHQLLEIPRTNLKTYGDRAFCVVAPKLWNCLPESLKCIKSRDSFKSALKTHLFRRL